MKNTHKIWLSIGVLVLILAVVIGFSNRKVSPASQGNALIRVRIGYLPVVHALPLYVAIDKGYFKDAGIDAEVTKFEAPNQIIDALLSGQIDVAMAAATGITAVAEGKKPGSLKIFAVQGGDDAHIAEALIVQKDSQVKTIAELKGKKIGLLPGIQWRTIARNMFDMNGLDINRDVTLVELAVPLQAQALATKQVDALLAVEPVLTIAKSLGASRDLVISPNLRYISNPFYAGVGDVSVSFMKKDPAAFEKVLAVFDRATKELDADIAAARPHLVGHTALTIELSKSVNLPTYKMSADMNANDVASVQKFIDVFAKYKVIENPVRAIDLMYRQ
ncbi:MAG: hypothetical protein JWO73_350 [Candidatus Taylorbacteria bacterium]|nr:hypothetical protein [Candidatus Taylorbacteria bacterium]